MKRLMIIFAVSAAVLFCGCEGAPRPTGTTSSPEAPVTPPATTPTPNIVGNWQFSATSSVPGTSPLTISGGISQDGTVVSGALHVNGSNCVDQLTTMSLTGTVNANGASLTATGMDGQALSITGTFSGSVPGSTFTGTYTIKGGCATGDQGKVTGIGMGYIPNEMAGTFTDSAQKTFNVSGDIFQSGSASSEGSYAIGANAPSTFDTPCFSSGTIKPGTFPSGSYLLGTSVALEFDTSNGILTVLGTWNPDSLEITGNYAISGGTCEDKGTAVLSLSSPWDY